MKAVITFVRRIFQFVWDDCFEEMRNITNSGSINFFQVEETEILQGEIQHCESTFALLESNRRKRKRWKG